MQVIEFHSIINTNKTRILILESMTTIVQLNLQFNTASGYRQSDPKNNLDFIIQMNIFVPRITY